MKQKNINMYKFKINKFQESFAFLWDNKNETIDLINEYLKEVKGSTYKAGRCFNADTNTNDSDILCIIENDECSTFFNVGEYIIHTKGGYFYPYSKEDLVKKNIELIEI